jgi:penicillin-binding protein 1A
VAAKLGQQVGFSTVADMARRFGITTPVNTHPSMVLGTSEVKVIDMTRAFASVYNKGVAVTPFGITKVVSEGQTIYEHEVDRSHVLVAPNVAAEMTDLLQTTVNTGTGRAAQIGRPVAGKTGTTSASKDGWFLGFSSGLTTGVWMGRDNARPIAGLHGGTAPARAFAQFMKVAVAKRPIEQFETQVTLPDEQIEPDDETYFGTPDDSGYAGGGGFVDADGNPIGGGEPRPAPEDQSGYGVERPVEPGVDQRPAAETPPPAARDGGRDDRLDQDWIDRVTGQDAPPPRRRPRDEGEEPQL